tara:strand:- start:165 stop:1400 length:1236 start_codon:yes stop_codon:yes gene_type:complete
MVGFGFADNAIMILAGDRIDATLGVAFGFSTLFAAGLGNLISDVAGISLGEAIEGACHRVGLEAPELSAAQYALRSTRVTKWLAGATGLTIGCVLGMVPLLFISDRKHVYFSDDDLALYQRQFAPYGVSPEQFFALMQSGTWHQVEAGSMLVRQGEQMDRVLLLHSGCAQSWTQMADGSRENVWLYTGKPGETFDVGYDGTLRGDPAQDGSGAQAQPSSPERMEAVAMRLAAEEAARHGQLRGCIIGGTALVEPDVLSKPYPNQVLVTHRAKYVSWKVHRSVVRVAVLVAVPRLATSSSSGCIRRLEGALRTREEEPFAPDPTERPWPFCQRPPVAPFSPRLTICRCRSCARRCRRTSRSRAPSTRRCTSTWSRGCGASGATCSTPCGAATATRRPRGSPPSARRPRASTW